MPQSKTVKAVVAIFSLSLVLLLTSCAQLGALAGKMMTQKTADLSQAAVTVRYIQNLYTSKTQTTEALYLPALWKEGSNVIVVSFLKRKGIGMYSIDGKVTIGGDSVPHIANGVYAKAIDANDQSVQKVVIETVTGQRAEYEIGPTQKIEIVSVNGKKKSALMDSTSKETAVIDLQKDFELELVNPPGSEGTQIKLAMIGNIMGTRSFTEVGIFKAADKIVVPSAIFNNPMGSLLPNMGANYLLVERFTMNFNPVKGVGATQALATSWDCVPVTLVGNQEKTAFGVASGIGVQVQKEITTEHGKMKIDFSKPNAFLGRPFSSGKKFAVTSFTLRATQLQQSQSSTSTSTTETATSITTTTTTTTTTRTFPTLPDAYWNDLVEKLYKDFESVLLSNYKIEIIPIEKTLAAPSYQGLEPIPDEVTVVKVEKSYKGTKNLLPTNIGAMLKSVSSTFASDRMDARLVRELGVDGLIAVTIDLAMPWQEFTLTPSMSVRITGGPNGYTAGPTVYAQGLISGQGVPLDSAKMDAQSVMDVLPNIIRRDDLKSALGIAFKDLTEAEKDKGYDRIWSLK